MCPPKYDYCAFLPPHDCFARPPHSYPASAHVRTMRAAVRVKCSPDDTVGDLKRLIAAQTGTDHTKIQLKKWYTIYKDHITLADYEIHDGMSLEMY
ncbi:hypothetical protein ONZ51_g11174 [Trametes cubensis]|uniref:Ubiquitin-like modifier HUB1 n=1 Tax=Trametes cubensis TaxID=1111947 RepID=A0AAD7X843_9APHY|nr:hypothetical protein ONZ51_g11174 [Trametes cubensis]